jgi:type II secretory pathway pseudopilin PulG
MDTPAGPDSKKGRWSPSASPAAQRPAVAVDPSVYANYGYSPQAQAQHQAAAASPQIYSTPQLSINTAALNGGQQQGGQISPNTMAAFQAHQQQQQQAAAVAAHQQQQQQQAQQQQQGGQSPVVGPGSPYGTFNPYASMLGMYAQQQGQGAFQVCGPILISSLLAVFFVPFCPRRRWSLPLPASSLSFSLSFPYLAFPCPVSFPSFPFPSLLSFHPPRFSILT